MTVTASTDIVQVDAFTDRPFEGNPAAVCVLSGAAPADWMQAVAAEMNLSETAFLYPKAGGYHLRWFTPAAEVDLCGHATLASAHVLWSEGHLAPDQEAQFQTRSGVLTATQADGWITLNFPARLVSPISPSPTLLRALGGVQPNYVGSDGDAAEANRLVELESAAVVRSLQPDFAIMTNLLAQGVIVTALADDPDLDFVSRYFAPAIGINEDPVTGAAHCYLAPYWHSKLNKTKFWARQVSARGGLLQVSHQGDRVFISGQAVTVLKGTLLSAPDSAT